MRDSGSHTLGTPNSFGPNTQQMWIFKIWTPGSGRRSRIMDQLFGKG